MIIGFTKIPIGIGNKEMNVEISDIVPDGYNFLKEHDSYKIYEKCENDGDDINHYYIAIIKYDV